jgi:hypothetical protein
VLLSLSNLDGIDTEYLITLIGQVRCKNNGIKSHVNKKGFLENPGVMVNGDHLSFEYLQEKTALIDALLDTIEKDILLKSGRLRMLNN